jgi:CHAD domain-containing protein
MAKAKEIEGLDCGRDAFFNIDLILRTRLEEMCELREKALDWTDIEGVHDMRVASRRLRSALRDLAHYFTGRKGPQKQLKEIARSLGAVRDEDVAIVALKRLRHQAEEAEEVSAGMKQLIEERHRRQELAREHLQLAISDEAINQFQEKFNAWLRSAAATRANKVKEDSTHTGLTLREMAREVILSQYRELDGLSSSLFSPFDVEPLHSMRIAAKRLRYSLELFSPCFGEGSRALAKEIAELQTSLGELHDCDVWIDDLGVRLGAREDDALSGHAGGAQSRQTAEAASDLWLLQHFVKERTKHYTDALSLWFEWKDKGFYSKLNEHLHETIEPQPTEGRPGAD